VAGTAAAVGAATAFPAQALAGSAEASSDAARLQQANTLILEPSWTLAYVDDDVELLRDHSIVVSNGVIADIVPGRIRGNNTRVPMGGQLLIPGMISGHTHVAMATPTRGIIESGRNFGVPALQMFNLSDDDLDALTAYNLAEILRAGCTTQVEQALDLRQVKSYVKVARNWGVRGYPGGMVPNFKTVVAIRGRTNDSVLFNSVPGTLAEIQANLEYGLTINGAEGGRLLPQIAPQGPETGTPETLQACYDAAVRLGHGLHTHLSTTVPDVNHIKRLWGKPPVEWIDEFGWYDVPLMAAHMGAWEGPSDAAFLADKPNFRHVYCPSGAGVGSGGGSNPYIEMLGTGLPTSIGLDSHSNDLLEQAKTAVLYGRLRYALLNATSPLPMKRPTVWDMI
jgi:cytosine/adenosine deaminase-related metal-dependent hydrolase